MSLAQVEQAIGAGGADVVFIDDKLENVQGAAAHAGWSAVHHRGDARETAAAVLALLGLPASSSSSLSCS